MIIPPKDAIAVTRRPNTAPARPLFAEFAAQLEEEIAWIQELHHNDKSGQAASDIRSLRNLVRQVRDAGEKLGFIP